MDIIQSIYQLSATDDQQQKQKLKEELIFQINKLLVNDFEKLVQMLYSVDVDEQKLKLLLKQHADKDAAILITDLVIERQEQKKSTRDNSDGSNICDEEKW